MERRKNPLASMSDYFFRSNLGIVMCVNTIGPLERRRVTVFHLDKNNYPTVTDFYIDESQIDDEKISPATLTLLSWGIANLFVGVPHVVPENRLEQYGGLPARLAKEYGAWKQVYRPRALS